MLMTQLRKETWNVELYLWRTCWDGGCHSGVRSNPILWDITTYTRFKVNRRFRRTCLHSLRRRSRSRVRNQHEQGSKRSTYGCNKAEKRDSLVCSFPDVRVRAVKSIRTVCPSRISRSPSNTDDHTPSSYLITVLIVFLL
jgi:hypothetical protein